MAVDFAQYSVARSQSRKTRITRRNLYKDLKYVFEPITQWPRQTGITKKGRKSCLTVPLKGIWQSHMTPRSIYCAEFYSMKYYVTARRFEIFFNISVKTKQKIKLI